MAQVMLTNLPDGVKKIGLIRWADAPARVWWEWPDGKVFSTNLEGQDLLDTGFRRDSKPRSAFIEDEILLDAVNRLSFREGAIVRD